MAAQWHPLSQIEDWQIVPVSARRRYKAPRYQCLRHCAQATAPPWRTRGFRYRSRHRAGGPRRLSPAQWMALRYFARANTFSRTPSAFAEFQATTRGTPSQAIKALEAGGYLVRQRSKADGRSVSLRLTSKGKKALARDPFEVLVRAVDLLDAKERTVIHHALHQVLTTLAASGARRRFG